MDGSLCPTNPSLSLPPNHAPKIKIPGVIPTTMTAPALSRLVTVTAGVIEMVELGKIFNLIKEVIGN